MLGNRLRLEHLDRTAARAAIVRPIDAYNGLAPEDRRVEIEPKLVEAILDQVAVATPGYPLGGDSGGQIEAPYLQLVMQRLWDDEERRDQRRLTLDALERLGGAEQIVEDHLEDALAPLTPREKDGAARMFNHLVTPSGTKIAHRVADLRAYAALPQTTSSTCSNGSRASASSDRSRTDLMARADATRSSTTSSPQPSSTGATATKRSASSTGPGATQTGAAAVR